MTTRPVRRGSVEGSATGESWVGVKVGRRVCSVPARKVELVVCVWHSSLYTSYTVTISTIPLSAANNFPSIIPTSIDTNICFRNRIAVFSQ